MRIFPSLILAFIVLISAHHARAFTGVCEVLFRAEEVPAAPVKNGEELPLTHIQWPQLREERLLSRELLEGLFAGIETGDKAGSAALRYMKTLPSEMDSATKANVWGELVRFIAHVKFIMFISDMYELDAGRFLFRGGTGHSIFIDSDGQVYRLMTKPLERQTSWILDRTQLTPLITPVPQ